MSSFKKANPALVEAFDRALPVDARVERKAMFGCPCAFVNGNMFAGVYMDTFIVRLPEAGRVEAARDGGGTSWAPGGRPMREYVAFPEDTGDRVLAGWLARGHAYAAALPVKEKKPPKAKAPKATTT